MNIQSMTGIGVAHGQKHGHMVTVEVKSVNHRFKDIRFKSGGLVKPLEFELKKKIEQEFQRGYFEVFIDCKFDDSDVRFDNIDPKAVESFLAFVSPIIKKHGFKTELQAVDFLRSEFMKENGLEHEQTLFIQEVFEKGVKNLRQSRLLEGEKIVRSVEGCRQEYQKHLNTIVAEIKGTQKMTEKKLMKRLKEMIPVENIDKPRFMQEVIYYLEKRDIEEELSRIGLHLEKLGLLLQRGGGVGREMDFLLQEINRETNTLSAKSDIYQISHCVVQMKVQLEKMREQALNIE